MITNNLAALVASSAHVRREWEDNDGQIKADVKYEPTNWGGTSAEEEREFLKGFNPESVCPTCHVTLSASGECAGFC